MASSTELRAARGRHAPPPEVRLPLQRQRLLRAAAKEIAERGYASAGTTDAAARLRAGTRAYLRAITQQPEFARTVFELGPVIDRLVGGVLARGS